MLKVKKKKFTVS